MTQKFIIGADEVGTGSAVGSLVVCGVRAPIDWIIPGLNDSKKLSPKRREELSTTLLASKDIDYVLAARTNNEIDTLGLGVALKQAYQEVADRLLTSDSIMVIDGLVRLPGGDPRISCLVKADQQIPTVMAASILAKVYRDGMIKDLSKQYPVYGWDKNVGYLTKEHLEAIRKYGLSELHRKSYKIKL